MEHERDRLPGELGGVASQGWIYPKVQKRHLSWSEDKVSAWSPYETERWAYQKGMTGLFNLLAQKEPPFIYHDWWLWAETEEYEVGGVKFWIDEASVYNHWFMEQDLRDPADFRKLYLQEYTSPEPSTAKAAGVGRTTDRKGDYEWW